VCVGIVIVVAVAKRDVPHFYASCLEWATYRIKQDRTSEACIESSKIEPTYSSTLENPRRVAPWLASNRVVTSPYGRITMVLSSRVATPDTYF
jgi:hypothetical protein